jgi:hypothetical protein
MAVGRPFADAPGQPAPGLGGDRQQGALAAPVPGRLEAFGLPGAGDRVAGLVEQRQQRADDIDEAAVAGAARRLRPRRRGPAVGLARILGRPVGHRLRYSSTSGSMPSARL